MPGLSDLSTIMSNLKPTLCEGEFVFVSRGAGGYGECAELEPIAACMEEEGLTLVLPKSNADAAGLQYSTAFRKITLQVHSSLEAVGLTALVTAALARLNISANVVAAYHHDHLFVPTLRAAEAVEALSQLAESDHSRA